MSPYLFSILAQSKTGSDWNWFLIFIVVVIILTIALIIQARFSKDAADEFAHHEAEDHHEEPAPEAALEAEPQPDPEPEPEPETETPAEPDDLKKLEGIGPKVASILAENGITTYAQLAGTPVETLDKILDDNDLHMMHPGSWPEQARLAAAGDWEAFDKLTEELHGGRAKT